MKEQFTDVRRSRCHTNENGFIIDKWIWRLLQNSRLGNRDWKERKRQFEQKTTTKMVVWRQLLREFLQPKNFWKGCFGYLRKQLHFSIEVWHIFMNMHGFHSEIIVHSFWTKNYSIDFCRKYLFIFSWNLCRTLMLYKYNLTAQSIFCLNVTDYVISLAWQLFVHFMSLWEYGSVLLTDKYHILFLHNNIKRNFLSKHLSVFIW